MDYGRLFSRAWEICWNNKWLFLLGFLAALGAGGGGGSNSGFQFDSGNFPNGITLEDPAGFLPPAFLDNIESLVALAVPVLIGLVCVGFLIGIAFWLLRLTAQAGMISTVVDVEGGEKVSLGKAFSKGFQFLPRLAGINIILVLPIILVVVIFMVVLLGMIGATAGFASLESTVDEFVTGSLVTFIALICVFSCVVGLYSLLVALLEPVAQRSAVVENQGVIDSLKRGWQVFTQNIGEVLILAVLYVVIGFVYGIIVTIVLIPFGLIIAAPTVFDFLSSGDISTGGIILAVIGFIVLGLVAAVLNALWVAFRSVSFTLAYQEFAQKTLKE